MNYQINQLSIPMTADTQTNKERITHILRKFPQAKYNRAFFFWKYIMEYVVGYDMPSITYTQFQQFWLSFAGIERSLRDLLRNDPEFKLKPKQDSKRYSKSNLFRETYAKTK